VRRAARGEGAMCALLAASASLVAPPLRAAPAHLAVARRSAHPEPLRPARCPTPSLPRWARSPAAGSSAGCWWRRRRWWRPWRSGCLWRATPTTRPSACTPVRTTGSAVGGWWFAGALPLVLAWRPADARPACLQGWACLHVPRLLALNPHCSSSHHRLAGASPRPPLARTVHSLTGQAPPPCPNPQAGWCWPPRSRGWPWAACSRAEATCRRWVRRRRPRRSRPGPGPPAVPAHRGSKPHPRHPPHSRSASPCPAYPRHARRRTAHIPRSRACPAS
jgi:hypothetical protein